MSGFWAISKFFLLVLVINLWGAASNSGNIDIYFEDNRVSCVFDQEKMERWSFLIKDLVAADDFRGHIRLEGINEDEFRILYRLSKMTVEDAREEVLALSKDRLEKLVLGAQYLRINLQSTALAPYFSSLDEFVPHCVAVVDPLTVGKASSPSSHASSSLSSSEPPLRLVERKSLWNSSFEKVVSDSALSNEDVIDCMIRHGRINPESLQKNIGLYYSKRGSFTEKMMEELFCFAIDEDALTLFEFLKNQGAKIRFEHLLRAVSMCSVRILTMMLQCTEIDEEDAACFLHAIACQSEIAGRLLAVLADVKHIDLDVCTKSRLEDGSLQPHKPLIHRAIDDRDLEVFHVLLASGRVNPCLVHDGATPLGAILKKLVQISVADEKEYDKQSFVYVTMLHMLFNTKVIDPNSARSCHIDGEGMLPLHYAVSEGCIKITKYLLSCGLIDVGRCNKKQKNALHIASSRCYHEIMNELIKTGKFDLNAPDADGMTPLDCVLSFVSEDESAAQQKERAKQLLLNNGADLSTAPDQGFAFSENQENGLTGLNALPLVPTIDSTESVRGSSEASSSSGSASSSSASINSADGVSAPLSRSLEPGESLPKVSTDEDGCSVASSRSLGVDSIVDKGHEILRTVIHKVFVEKKSLHDQIYKHYLPYRWGDRDGVLRGIDQILLSWAIRIGDKETAGRLPNERNMFCCAKHDAVSVPSSEYKYLGLRLTSPIVCAIKHKDARMFRKLVKLCRRANKFCVWEDAMRLNFDMQGIRVAGAKKIKKVDLNGLLCAAVDYGSIPTMEFLLSYGADMYANIGGRMYDSAIDRAVRRGYVKKLKFLVAYHGSLRQRGPGHHTWLHDAALFRRRSVMEFLLSQGLSINQKYADGDSLLHKEALCNDEDMQKFLLDNGAEVNIQDQYGNTPMHKAVRFENVPMMKLLLERGADLNLANSSKCTPFDLAKSLGQGEEILSIVQPPSRSQ